MVSALIDEALSGYTIPLIFRCYWWGLSRFGTIPTNCRRLRGRTQLLAVPGTVVRLEVGDTGLEPVTSRV